MTFASRATAVLFKIYRLLVWKMRSRSLAVLPAPKTPQDKQPARQPRRLETLEPRVLFSGTLSSVPFSGDLLSNGDLDTYAVDLLAGDRVAIEVASGDTATRLELKNSAGGVVASDNNGGPDSNPFISHYVVLSSGRYDIDVISTSGPGLFDARVTIARGGLQLETDENYANDSTSGADSLSFDTSGNVQTASVAGSIMAAQGTNTDQDTYRLGLLNAGTVVSLDASNLPAWSALLPTVELIGPNGVVTGIDTNPDDAVFAGTITQDGEYFARVRSTTAIIDGSRFSLNSESLNWTDARAAALGLGGDLASIDSAEQNRLLNQTFGQSAWIGFTDELTEGAYAWSDGSATAYTNWNPGEPNSPSHDYAYLSSNARWYDASSGSTYPSLVELPSQPGDPALAGAGLDSQYVLGLAITDLVPPVVTSANRLPDEAGTLNAVLSTFSLTFSEQLDQGTLLPSAFDLRAAGDDGLFDTADDNVYGLSFTYNSTNREINFTITDGPLVDGNHRLTVADSITDLLGNALDGEGDTVIGGDFVRSFTVDAVPAGVVFEGSSNDTYQTATALTMTADANGTGWLRSDTGYGSIDPNNDQDWWSFQAQAGDTADVWSQRLEGLFTAVNLYRLNDQGDGLVSLASDVNSGPDSNPYISGVVLPQTTTYFVRVTNWTGQPTGGYDVRVLLNRDHAVETDEDYRNDTVGSQADDLVFTQVGAVLSGTVAGTVMAGESNNADEDVYDLGFMRADSLISLSLTLPDWSSLRSPTLEVLDALGNVVTDSDADPLSVSAVASADGVYYARVRSGVLIQDGARYVYDDTARTWADAQAYAQSLGGHLVSYADDAERVAVGQALGYFNHWTGLSRQVVTTAGTLDGGDPVNPSNPTGAQNAYAQDVALDSLVQPVAGRWVLLGLSSLDAGGFAPVIQVIDDSDGTLVTWGGTSSTGPRSTSVSFVPEAGKTYTARVTSYSDNQSGAFSLNARTQDGFVWSDATPVGYTNWSPGEPNNGSSHPYAYQNTGGLWFDGGTTDTRPAVFELPTLPGDPAASAAGRDAQYLLSASVELRDLVPPVVTGVQRLPDEAGTLNAVLSTFNLTLSEIDPATLSPASFDLRAAGDDGLFDTADDSVYGLGYTLNNLTISFTVTDGPLVNGPHRFTLYDTLTDLPVADGVPGNPLDGDNDGLAGGDFVRSFTVDAVPEGVVFEGSSNDSFDTATALALTADANGTGWLRSDVGYGSIDPNNDQDWWSFQAQAGDTADLWSQRLSGLEPYITLYRLNNTGDGVVQLASDANDGPGSTDYISGYVLPQTTTYYVQVRNWSGSTPGGYDVRVHLNRDHAVETDSSDNNSNSNDSTSWADALAFVDQGSIRIASVAGTVMDGESGNVDEDYFSLGTVEANETILLSVSLPQWSAVETIIEVRNAQDQVVSLVTSPTGGVARAEISATGTYYATVVAVDGEGIDGQYLLNAAVGPTVEYVDLAVSSVAVPASAGSGETITVDWVGGNFGVIDLVQSSWNDRVYLSEDEVFGNADDVVLGTFAQDRALAIGETYSESRSVQLPSGIEGGYTVFVLADSGNDVAEFIAEGNNLGQSSQVLAVTRNYADLSLTGFGGPVSAERGTPVALDWTVTNVGEDSTVLGQWRDEIVFSVDGVLGNADDVVVGSYMHQGALPVGGTYQVSGFSVDLPIGIPLGAGNLFVRANADAAVEEDGRTTNNTGQQAIDVLGRPDLAVVAGSIVAPGSVSPGQSFALSWQVENRGSRDATGPWEEWVYISDNPSGTNRQFVGAFSFGDDLALGGPALTRSVDVTMPGLGLAGDVYLVVQIDAGDDINESGEANAFVSATPVSVPRVLALEINRESVSEGGSAQATLTRNGDVSSALVVTLGVDVAGQLTLPSQVTIQPGQYSVTFQVSADADGVVDGDVPVTVTASAPGYQASAKALTADDRDVAGLGLFLSDASLAEGGSGTATVQHNGPTDQPVVVSISKNTPGQVTLPGSVVIPAGQSSVTFGYQAIDDAVVEDDTPVSLSVASAGYQSATAGLTIQKSDLPAIAVSLPGSVVEGADPGAASGEVSIAAPLGDDLLVALTSSDPAALLVLPTVLIPAGQTSASFPLFVGDDALVNGTRTATITARVIPDNGGPAIDSTATSAATSVLDNDGPTLSVALNRAVAREGQFLDVTITRNTPTGSPLTVSLSSDNAGEITFPQTAVIPAGQSSVTVQVFANNDGTIDGDKTVSLFAQANGFNAGLSRFVVTDSDLPDLTVASVTTGSTAVTGQSVDVSWRVENTGVAPAVGSWVERVYLSSDAAPGGDTLLGEFAFTGPLNEDLGYDRTISVTLPEQPGDYWIVVEVDPTSAVIETLETNNTRLSSAPISVTPNYSATVSAGIDSAPAGTPVTLTGVATDTGGSPAAFVEVAVRVTVRGLTRTILATTDATGAYQAVFTPLAFEGGQYSVAASHPGVTGSAAQDGFQLYGLRPTAGNDLLGILVGDTETQRVTLRNLADLPLTGVSFQIVDASANLVTDARLLGGPTIAGDSSFQIEYDVTASDASIAEAGLTLRVTSNEAPTLDIPILVDVAPQTADLVVTSGPVAAKMLVGDQTSVNFTVQNRGGADSGPIQLLLPEAPWLTVASGSSIQNIASGQSATFVLLLTPPDDLELTAYTGSLIVRGENDDTEVPFSFDAIAETTGDLSVTVVDELFYFSEDQPLVSNATVVLRDAFTNQVVVSSDAQPAAPGSSEHGPGVLANLPDGEFLFSGLDAGKYVLEVSAEDHDRYSAIVTIDPAGQTDERVFISRNFVEYTWTVEEIEVEDRTRVTIDAVFQTNVPAPVVVADFDIDLADLTTIGQTQQYTITYTNHGFIQAEDVAVRVSEHPYYQFTPLVDSIPVLPAKSSVQVPVTVTRIAGPDTQAALPEPGVDGAQHEVDSMFAALGGYQLAQLAGAASTAWAPATLGAASAPCYITAYSEYWYRCGPAWIRKTIPHLVKNVDGDCPTGPGLPGGPGGGGGGTTFGGGGGFGGGGWGSRGRGGVGRGGPVISSPTPVTPSIPQGCDPCIQQIGKEALDYLGDKLAGKIKDKIPYVPEIEQAIDYGDAVQGLADAATGGDTSPADALKKAAKVGLGLVGLFPTPVGAAARGALLLWDLGERLGKILDACTDLFGEAAMPAILNGDLTTQQLLTQNNLSGGQNIQQAGSAISAALQTLDALSAPEAYLYGSADFLNLVGSGDPAGWLDAVRSSMVDPDGTLSMVSPEQVAILKNTAARPNTVSDAEIDAFAQRINRSLQYWDSGYFNASDLPAGMDSDFIELDVWRDLMIDSDNARATLGADQLVGFAESMDALAFGMIDALNSYSDNGVCAEVRLQISQDVVQTRQAFSATLGIDNNTTDTLTDIDVDVIVLDAAGNNVTDLFGVQVQSIEGLGDVNGQGSLAALGSGSANWLLVPSAELAVNGPTEYFVAGTLSYQELGIEVQAALLPRVITVLPQPELELDYFLQRDVVSDDPFTDEIEPTEPFILGVQVNNAGAGAANNLRIESAQPKIIENEKGLLIDFEIIGTRVNGMDVQRTLTALFGTIDPGSVGTAEWQLESTLQGLFTEYEASFEHLSNFGSDQLSLIKSVEIHELIRSVQATASGLNDNVSDFLVNDVADPFDLPDTLYLSDGTVMSVSLGTDALADSTPSLADLSVGLTATMPAGWSYLKLEDPSNGALDLAGVMRSDGTFLPVENFWQTDRTFIGGGVRPVYENNIHILDFDSTGQYELVYSNGDLTGPTVQAFDGVDPNPTDDAIDAIQVSFDEAVAAASLTADDFTLTKDGAPVALTGVTITPISSTQFALTGLAPFTQDDAVYELTLAMSGVTDLVNNSGNDDASYTWVKGEAAPAVIAIAGAPAGLTDTPPTQIDITLTEPVTLASLQNALSLTRGGVDALAGPASITDLGGGVYRMDNLGTATAIDGNYQLTIDATQLTDLVGTAGIGVATRQWSLDTAGPTVVDVVDPFTNPRNTVVQRIDVVFSEMIDLSTFSVDDLALVRDGGVVNLIAGDDRVSIEHRFDTVYRITGINWVQGFIADPQIADFTIRVDATGVTDLAGNAGTNTDTATWTIDLDPPPGPTNVRLFADNGEVQGSSVGHGNALITGELSEAGLTVVVTDLTNDTELARETVPGNSFAIPILLESAGRHELEIRTIDPAGNTTDTPVGQLIVEPTPAAIDSTFGLPGANTNLFFDSFDVTFVAEIDPATVTSAAFTLTRDGGPNLIHPAVTITPQPDGRTFRVAGLTPLTMDEGGYELSIDLSTIRTANGVSGFGTFDAAWRMDTGAPTSRVRALAESQPIPSFVISVEGSDPALGNGAAGSGIDRYDIYVSVDGGDYTFLDSLPAQAATRGFTGEVGSRYAFYSIARDNAGNIEAPPTLADAATLLPSTIERTPGDTDGDGDVDDADLGTAFANYTGPLAPGTGGKTADDGDQDGDGDVDDADLGTAFANYTGPFQANPDTDGDGDIDDADLANAFSNYTGPVGIVGNKTTADGDADGDGDVDDADLATLFSRYTGPLSPIRFNTPSHIQESAQDNRFIDGDG
ncbi:MAG: CARDB domain-containing protein [Phycisphaeraceae bacterium]